MNEANIVGENSYNPLSSYPHETTNESSYSLKYIHTKKILLMNIFYRTCSHITQKYK